MATKKIKKWELERIKNVESYAQFKTFLIRVGFHSFDEYMKLFGDDMQKRLDAVNWFIDTYQVLDINY